MEYARSLPKRSQPTQEDEACSSGRRAVPVHLLLGSLDMHEQFFAARFPTLLPCRDIGSDRADAKGSWSSWS
jgi:hypothetical protein